MVLFFLSVRLGGGGGGGYLHNGKPALVSQEPADPARTLV